MNQPSETHTFYRCLSIIERRDDKDHRTPVQGEATRPPCAYLQIEIAIAKFCEFSQMLGYL